MFTQAGFSVAGARRVAWARVSRLGRSGIVWGFLVRWPCGDLAWGSRTQVCWPEKVRIHSLLDGPAPGPHWPLDPEDGAREWLALGVDPNRGGFRASIDAAVLRQN